MKQWIGVIAVMGLLAGCAQDDTSGTYGTGTGAAGTTGTMGPEGTGTSDDGLNGGTLRRDTPPATGPEGIGPGGSRVPNAGTGAGSGSGKGTGTGTGTGTGSGSPL